MSTTLIQDLKDAIESLDADKATEIAEKCVETGVDLIDAIEKGIAEGLRVIGEKFEKGELFLMHLITAGEIAKKVIGEILQPELMKRRRERKILGRVVIGTVAGDIHDIGKNIVATMLFAAGFDVYDLGVDVPVEAFVNKAREVNADIVAASALLTTTLPVQAEIIKALKDSGIRNRVKVMVGGAPANEDWAKQIGADGYAPDAIEAVKVAKKLVGC